jgi:hypothetical protein
MAEDGQFLRSEQAALSPTDGEQPDREPAHNIHISD